VRLKRTVAFWVHFRPDKSDLLCLNANLTLNSGLDTGAVKSDGFGEAAKSSKVSKELRLNLFSCVARVIAIRGEGPTKPEVRLSEQSHVLLQTPHLHCLTHDRHSHPTRSLSLSLSLYPRPHPLSCLLLTAINPFSLWSWPIYLHNKTHQSIVDVIIQIHACKLDSGPKN
jgi:hypothetical protein